MISVFILLPLYAVGIQYERKGVWYVVLPVTVVALVLDFLLNYTELALLTWDYPMRGEFTFSTRLKRLKSADGWRGSVARYIARALDAIAPSGVHV